MPAYINAPCSSVRIVEMVSSNSQIDEIKTEFYVVHFLSVMLVEVESGSLYVRISHFKRLFVRIVRKKKYFNPCWLDRYCKEIIEMIPSELRRKIHKNLSLLLSVTVN